MTGPRRVVVGVPPAMVTDELRRCAFAVAVLGKTKGKGIPAHEWTLVGAFVSEDSAQQAFDELTPEHGRAILPLGEGTEVVLVDNETGETIEVTRPPAPAREGWGRPAGSRKAHFFPAKPVEKRDLSGFSLCGGVTFFGVFATAEPAAACRTCSLLYAKMVKP